MSSIRPKASKVTQTSEQIARSVLNANVAPDPQPPGIASFLAPVLSETQHAVLEQYRIDLNVVILPPHKKGGISTKLQQTTRLFFDESDPYNPEGLLAAAAGECNVGVMTGHTSGKNGTHLTVIDCETEQILEIVIRELNRLGIPIYGVKSYRGGHIYIRTRRRLKKLKIDGVIEFITHKFHVLSYPSTRIIDDQTGEVHTYTRFGDAIEPPLVNASEIAFDLGDGTALKLDSRPARQNRGFNTLTLHYLANGHAYEDGRKDACLQSACDMHGNQHSMEQIAARLIPIVERSGFSGMNHAQAIKKAWELIKWACSKPRNTSRPRYAQWQLVLAHVYDHPFTGDTRRRNRLKAVISGLAQRARVDTDEHGNFRATERELVLITGIKKRATIRRAIGELVELGLLRKIEYPLPADAPKQKYREANLFTWGKVDVWYPLASKMLEPVSYSGYQTGIFKTDAIEAIAASAGYVYEAMKTRAYPMKVREIATLANVSESAVRRALDKDCLLVTQGLIQRVEGGWIAQRTTNQRLIELIAVPAGVHGKRQAHKDALDKERALYATHDVIRFRWTRSGAAYQEKVRELTAYHMALYPDLYAQREARKLEREARTQAKNEQAQTVDMSTIVDAPIPPLAEISTDQRAECYPMGNSAPDLPTSNLVSADVAHKIDSSPIAPPTPEAVEQIPHPETAYQNSDTPQQPPATLPAIDGYVNVTARELARLEAIEQAQGDVSEISDKPQAVTVQCVGKLLVAQEKILRAPQPAAPVPTPKGYTAENAFNVNKYLFDMGQIDKPTYLENGRNIAAWDRDKNRAAINQFAAEYTRRKEAYKESQRKGKRHA